MTRYVGRKRGTACASADGHDCSFSLTFKLRITPAFVSIDRRKYHKAPACVGFIVVVESGRSESRRATCVLGASPAEA